MTFFCAGTSSTLVGEFPLKPANHSQENEGSLTDKRHRVEGEGQASNRGQSDGEREARLSKTKFLQISPVHFLFFITKSVVVLNWGSGERVCWQTFSHWKRDRLVCICSGSVPHWVSACRWKWLFVIINPGNGRDVCPHSLRHAWLWSSNTEDNTARSEPRNLLPTLNTLFMVLFRMRLWIFRNFWKRHLFFLFCLYFVTFSIGFNEFFFFFGLVYKFIQKYIKKCNSYIQRFQYASSRKRIV